MKIFVSYGHEKHGNFVKKLASAVEEKTNGKINVCIDHKSILQDSRWRKNITDRIAESDCVLAFLSEYSSTERGICLDELAIAIASKHGMIKTVLLEPADSFDPPAMVSEYQWNSMSDYPEYEKKGGTEYSAYINEKADMIIKMLGSDEVKEYNREICMLRQKLSLPEIPTLSRFDKLMENEISGRKWLKDKIQNWLGDDNAKRILMIYGKPGAGKTMFCAHLQHYNPFVAASFACDYQSDEYSSTDRIIKWLAYKLAMRLPDYRSWLISLFNDGNFNPGSGKDMFKSLIAAPLGKCSIDGKRGRMVIIIDALDEAKTDELAKFVVEYIDILTPWLRFMITARREPDIVERFAQYPSIDIDSRGNENHEDLKAYYESRLGEVLTGYSEKDKFTEKLIEASEGVFTYAECVCGNILNDLKEHSISLMDYPLPRGIEELFKSTFDRRFGENNPKYKKIWKEPLGMIIASPEPMPKKTLKTLMEWGNNKLNDFLYPLSSFITEDNENLKVFHRSFAEWLDSTHTEYRSEISDGIKSIAEKCFDVYETDIEDMDDYMLLYTIQLLRKSGLETKYKKITEDGRFISAVFNKQNELHKNNIFTRALKYIEMLIKIFENADIKENEGANLYNYSVSLEKKCRILKDLNMFSEAIKIHEKTLNIFKKLTEQYPEDQAYQRGLSISLNNFADILQSQNNLSEARNLYNKSIETNKKLTEKHSENPDYTIGLAISLDNTADTLTTQHDLQGALKLYNQSVEIKKELAEKYPENPDYIWNLSISLEKQSLVYVKLNSLQQALNLQRQTLEIRKKLSEQYPGNPDYMFGLSAALCNLAYILKDQNDLQQALKLSYEAVEIRKKLSEQYPENPYYIIELSDALCNSASILEAQNNLQGASKLFYQSIEIDKKLTEKYPENPDYQTGLSAALCNLAFILEAQNDLNGALNLFSQSIEIDKKLTEKYPENPDYIHSLSIILKRFAKILKAQNNLKDALKLYNNAFEIEKILAEKYPETPDYIKGLSESLNNIADIHKDCNDFTGALKLYIQAIKSEKNLAEKYPENPDYVKLLSVTLNNAADIFKASNDLQNAYKLYRQSFENWKKLSEKYPENPDYIRGLSILSEKIAEIFYNLNDLSNALKFCGQSIKIKKELTEKYPENPKYFEELATAYFNYGRVSENSEYLIKAFKLAKKYPDLPLCRKIISTVNYE